MNKFNLKNLISNQDGIIICGKFLVVRGYDKKDGIQRFYNSKEDLTSRIQGTDMPNGNHYLVDEYDQDHLNLVQGHELDNVTTLRRAYKLRLYNGLTRIAIGTSITRDQYPELLDQISIKLANDGEEAIDSPQ
jgi:hypothetical protein